MLMLLDAITKTGTQNVSGGGAEREIWRFRFSIVPELTSSHLQRLPGRFSRLKAVGDVFKL